jgi:dethiobiotin synthetase
VETGCGAAEDGSLYPTDAALLAEVAGHSIACPFRFREPLAPAAAAAIEGHLFDSLEARRIWLEHSARVDFALAEGAGGLLVPLAANLTTADLIAALEMPVLIVARDSLGTINHTALTIEVANQRGLAILGFVFSATGQVSDARAADNARSIVELTGARFLGRVARLGKMRRAELVNAALELDPLLTDTESGE